MVGALRFKDETLLPNKTKEYIIGVGIAASAEEADLIFKRFDSAVKFDKALAVTKDFWAGKISSIQFNFSLFLCSYQ